jgi:hypothetical protein
MKLKKLLTVLLCGALALSMLACVACSESDKKPQGNGGQNSGVVGDEDDWTGIY